MKCRAILLDAGVTADFYCSCGHKFRVDVWGMVFHRNRNGKIVVEPKKKSNPVKTCRCGKQYVFAAIPDLLWKHIK